MPFFLLRYLGRCVLLLAVLVVVALGFAVQRHPLLPPAKPGANASLAAKAKLLWGQVRPGAVPAGVVRDTVLNEQDLNALLDQAALTQGGKGRAQLTLATGTLGLLAQWPLGPLWLNLRLQWDLRDPRPGQLPPLVAARVGHLPLPSRWVQWGLQRALPVNAQTSLHALLPMLDGWQASPKALRLKWRWQPEQASAAVGALWSDAEREALVAQHAAYLALVGQHEPDSFAYVGDMLPKLAQLGLQRVQLQGRDAAQELRAVLLTLGLHTLGRDMGPWLPEVQALGRAPLVRILLAGRDDMSQHFLLATLLSWQGGPAVAKAMGLAKELADERVGSGFSFNDLAADEAGNRLGACIARDPLAVLQALAAAPGESTYFPDVSDLPEFLHEEAFVQRYGRLGSPAYEAEMARIRQRVANLPFYKGLPGP
jgi:hypothetical protein